MDCARRPRRLRATDAMRGLVRETRVDARQLVLPVFVADGLSEPREIASMPGVFQHTLESVRQVAADVVAVGLGGIMVFGVPRDGDKDATGSGALDEQGILARAIREVRAEVGDEAVVMSDVCLDEFTDHGHCGVLDADGRVDNDRTVDAYVQMSVLHAECGVHMVGPSGMMDGQVAAIRAGLDKAGRVDVSILAYTAKYASAWYGPFREAVDCSLTGDRKTYQQEPANAAEALVELELDLAEGADIVMVKPAMGYLDIIAAVRESCSVPVAAYNVSGEYAMLAAAARNGWIDKDRAVDETLTSIRRAGADIILTYWALDWAKENTPA